MPGSRFSPPRDGRQNGLRTVSTCRAGSQKPIEMPIVALAPQLHNGLLGLPPLSSCPPKFAIVALPMVIGRMHDQQMSVIGLGNLPVHVAMDADAAAVDMSSADTARRKRVNIF